MKIAILISTCDKYHRVAKFTRKWIDRYWTDHPPVFFCGSQEINDERRIQVVHDQKDWMGILFHATSELLERGYSHIYLILDDHPPLWKCHADHLNKTIPDLMNRFKALYVGLNGWGQGRAVTGKILGKRNFQIENVSSEYLWKFQVHPALWDLAFLNKLLGILIENLNIGLRNPWAFERRTGAVDASIPEEWKKSAYRISGRSMTHSQIRYLIQRALLWAGKVIRYLLGKTLGSKCWVWMDRQIAFLFQFYEGPYPLIWSGLLKKGALNPEMVRYLRFFGKKKFLKELLAVFQKS